VLPGTAREIGPINAVITRALGLAAGTNPPHLFTTLGRHRRLFRPWLRFAGRLMPAGKLPRADTELVILRVAHLTGCDYEREHHEHLAPRAGLSHDEIERSKLGPGVPGWTSRQRALLSAVDELVDTTRLRDERWAELRQHLSDIDAIELCLLTGHYVMLAMTINALRIEPDTRGRRRDRRRNSNRQQQDRRS
jgi:AhpD family alkylhydroperoxidase